MREVSFIVASLLVGFGIYTAKHNNVEAHRTLVSASKVDKPQEPVLSIKTQSKAVSEPKITTCEQAIRAYFPADKVNIMLAIGKAESSLISNRIGAVNNDDSIDYGCMMINNKAHAEWFKTHKWDDPEQNVLFARQLSKDGTRLTPWSVYNSGKYKAFLN